MRPSSLITPAYDVYLVPVRPHAQLWRLALGIALIVLAYVAPWIGVMIASLPQVLGVQVLEIWNAEMIARPAGTLALLATFAGPALGCVVAARLVHRRSPGTLLGRGARVVHDFVVAAALVPAVVVVTTIPWAFTWDARPNLDAGIWLRLLPLALAGVLLQTLAEELVFRGYLMGQLAARFRPAIVWLVLPALAFGFVHYDPRANGANAWVVIGAATAFGLVAGDLTRRTGSLGAAWGMHFANNAIALLILGTQGSITGLALWVTPYSAADSELVGQVVGDLVGIALIWAILVRILRR